MKLMRIHLEHFREFALAAFFGIIAKSKYLPSAADIFLGKLFWELRRRWVVSEAGNWNEKKIVFKIMKNFLLIAWEFFQKILLLRNFWAA
jgi:hypothetical protein